MKNIYLNRMWKNHNDMNINMHKNNIWIMNTE